MNAREIFDRLVNLDETERVEASQKLRHLRDAGLLKQMGKGSATYYVPTEQLLGEGLSPQSGTLSPELEVLSPDPRALSPDPARDALLAELTEEIRDRVTQLGRRSRDKDRLLAVCGHRYYSADELARITGRNAEYLQKGYLSPLVAEGRLAYRYPDDPNHPQQAYGLASLTKG